MRTTRRVSLLLAASSAVHAYHQSEFEGLWEEVPQTCINVRAGVQSTDAQSLSAMSLESAPQVEFDLHPDERIEIDDDDDVLRRELGI